MLSNQIIIQAKQLRKTYRIYSSPFARVLQKLCFGRRNFYREFTALEDITFDVQRGETVGIIGCNGSGKSTLLQMISGILKPTAGSLHVAGRISALLELGAGFHPEFTGRENVYMQGAIMGIDREEMNARFSAINEFAGIGDFIEQPVKTYSSGMFVRLAFASAIHMDPDLLLIDEALSVGDAAFNQKCMRFFRTFKERGTLLVVSHDTQALTGLCDRVIWIADGKIRMEGNPKDVCESYLTETFGHRDSAPRMSKVPVVHDREAAIVVDQRQALVNASNLRNDLELFRFDSDAPSFSGGRAQILDVRMVNEEGFQLAWVVGGEMVTLVVAARTNVNLSSTIVGFYVKDKLGQTLFGDNTFLTYAQTPVVIHAGRIFEAKFRFQMPRLPKGDYSICVALADGTQQLHETLHWIHDALLIRSKNDSVSQGLVGIPMVRIELHEAQQMDPLDEQQNNIRVVTD